jgi:hypothetical protein
MTLLARLTYAIDHFLSQLRGANISSNTAISTEMQRLDVAIWQT